MNKESILDLLKHLILQVRDHSKEIQPNPQLRMDWVAKHQHLDNAIKSLNSSDRQWLEDEYTKWFNSEIRPGIQPI